MASRTRVTPIASNSAVRTGCAHDVFRPAGVGAVPLDGVGETARELELRLPAELALELAGIDRVAPVVPEPVGDVAHEAPRLAERVQDERRDVDVLALVAAPEV